MWKVTQKGGPNGTHICQNWGWNQKSGAKQCKVGRGGEQGNTGADQTVFSHTSGCPWSKATLKSPVGARDLGPLWSFIRFIFSYLLLFIWPLPFPHGPAPCPALQDRRTDGPCPAPCPALSGRPFFRIRLSGPVPPRQLKRGTVVGRTDARTHML
jgi:hypothetical protein